MRTMTVAVALAALLAAQAAQAARDPGLMLHDTHGGGRALGVGVQAGVTIPLGGARRSAEARTPRLSLRAGPSMVRSGSAVTVRQRSAVAPLAEFALRPGHSTKLSFAGQPLAASYATPALRDAEVGPDGPRQGISTIGIVAIGVGVAVIVGGLLVVDAARDASD